jgi:hypothetical protein
MKLMVGISDHTFITNMRVPIINELGKDTYQQAQMYMYLHLTKF